MHTLTTLVILLLTTVGANAQDPVFYWDMETDIPNIFKTDSTARFYADAYVTDSAAYVGDKSFRNSGAWALTMFDNPTLQDEWCPVSEGSFEFYWQYLPPWDGKMIFQITGKDVYGSEDTNDALKVTLRGNTEGRFNAILGWHHDVDSSWQTRTLQSRIVSMKEGQWYRFRVTYAVGTGITMQIDDGVVESLDDPLGETRCTAWHHLLIGNDTFAEGIQYIDEFRVWATAVGVYDTSGTSAVSYGVDAVHPVTAYAYPNPMRNAVRFVTGDGPDVTGFAVYDRLGKMIFISAPVGANNDSPLQWGGNNMAGKNVPAGVYFYRLNTGAAGMVVKE